MSACAGRCLSAARLTPRSAAAPAIFAARSSGLGCRHAYVAVKPRTSSSGLCRRNTQDTRRHASAASAAEPSCTEPAHPLLKFAAAVLAVWQHSLKRLEDFIQWKGGQQDVTLEEKNAQVRQTLKNMRCLCAVAPFAAANVNTASVNIVQKALFNFVRLYLLALFSRVLLSWFPVFDWERQPWLAVRQVTDPYLNLFRGILPPLLGSVDFTPLFGFYVLQMLQGALTVQDLTEPLPEEFDQHQGGLIWKEMIYKATESDDPPFLSRHYKGPMPGDEDFSYSNPQQWSNQPF